MENNNLGTFIRDARIAKGLSRQALSDACGVNYTQIIRIENGKVKKPYLSTLKSICEALDISFNEALKKCGYSKENDNSTEDITLGTRIRNARIAKGYSQFTLSDLSGVAQSQICDIETGKSRPYSSTLKKICDALSLDFEEVSKLS